MNEFSFFFFFSFHYHDDNDNDNDDDDSDDDIHPIWLMVFLLQAIVKKTLMEKKHRQLKSIKTHTNTPTNQPAHLHNAYCIIMRRRRI